MSIKDRKERERDERRDLILSAASEIITTEGIDNFSVRKLATKIDYSPSIIYHYFEDKDDIINQLMRRNYQKIISGLSVLEMSAEKPEQQIKDAIRNFINLALNMSDQYLSIMLNTSPQILEHTSVLFKGASQHRKAVSMLCRSLQEIYTTVDDDFIELTAQVIWTASFGLIVRLMVEKNIDDEQRTRLIEHHLNIIIDGALKKEM